MMRAIGFICLALGSLAALGELRDIAFPTARWFFEVSREIPWLHCEMAGVGGSHGLAGRVPDCWRWEACYW